MHCKNWGQIFLWPVTLQNHPLPPHFWEERKSGECAPPLVSEGVFFAETPKFELGKGPDRDFFCKSGGSNNIPSEFSPNGGIFFSKSPVVAANKSSSSTTDFFSPNGTTTDLVPPPLFQEGWWGFLPLREGFFFHEPGYQGSEMVLHAFFFPIPDQGGFLTPPPLSRRVQLRLLGQLDFLGPPHTGRGLIFFLMVRRNNVPPPLHGGRGCGPW